MKVEDANGSRASSVTLWVTHLHLRVLWSLSNIHVTGILRAGICLEAIMSQKASKPPPLDSLSPWLDSAEEADVGLFLILVLEAE